MGPQSGGDVHSLFPSVNVIFCSNLLGSGFLQNKLSPGNGILFILVVLFLQSCRLLPGQLKEAVLFFWRFETEKR